MEIKVTLNATPRAEVGSGVARQLRREGMVPAVLYGQGQDAQSLVVNHKELRTALYDHAGALALFNLRIEGEEGQAEEKTVTLKDHQVDPIKRTILHADFLEVDINKPLELEVALVLQGKPEGVERGAMLQQIRREVTVSAMPLLLPDQIEVDVSLLEVGESVHVSDIVVPEGVKIVYDVNYTVATLAMPRSMKADEEGEEEEEEAASSEE
jgi:large subunit ribosomal protein L25